MNKDTAMVTLERDMLFRFADYRNKDFARYVQGMLMQDCRRHGFARRLLNHKAVNEEGFTVNLKFERNMNSALISDQYTYAQSRMYVEEDRELFRRLRRQVPKENVMEIEASKFNPQVFAHARGLVAARMIPVIGCIFSNHFWSQLLASPDFYSLIDPSHRAELVLNGDMGSIIGMNMLSDAFRPPQHKVLETAEIFFFGAREDVGNILLSSEKHDVEIKDCAENGEVWTEWAMSTEFAGFSNLNYKAVSILRLMP